MDSEQRQVVDQSLQELGAVPPAIEQLIERYVGSASLDALQADALLITLNVARTAPESEPPLRPSDAAPEFGDDGDTDGPPMQRMDARLARQSSQPGPPLPASASSRHNTPFPAGLPGADDMPDIARRVPPPRAPSPLSPMLVAPPSAAEPEPETLAAEPEAPRLEVPEQSAEIPKLPHDDFDVVVDDEIVELDDADMELDGADDR